MPDYNRSMFLECGSAEQTDEQKADLAKWLTVTKYYLSPTLEKGAPMPTKARQATYWWMMCIQSILIEIFGEGLERYCTPATPTFAFDLTAGPCAEAAGKAAAKKRKRTLRKGAPHSEVLAHTAHVTPETFWTASPGIQRTLFLPQGQCSVGMAGVGFLKYHYKLALQEVPDAAHRVANDLKCILAERNYGRTSCA